MVAFVNLLLKKMRMMMMMMMTNEQLDIEIVAIA